jgi:hypothetical protein
MFLYVLMSLKKKDKIHCWYLTHSTPPPTATHGHRPAKRDLIQSWITAQIPPPPSLPPTCRHNLLFWGRKPDYWTVDSDWLVGYSPWLRHQNKENDRAKKCHENQLGDIHRAWHIQVRRKKVIARFFFKIYYTFSLFFVNIIWLLK